LVLEGLGMNDMGGPGLERVGLHLRAFNKCLGLHCV
jgi:hypothetical protein